MTSLLLAAALAAAGGGFALGAARGTRAGTAAGLLAASVMGTGGAREFAGRVPGPPGRGVMVVGWLPPELSDCARVRGCPGGRAVALHSDI